ncbi:restriction endonuclease subunit S [Methylococcus sp. EFPC2]|uniref:restriction endonuclease subunit S n=1 Tax=Methylococcus sp. EFPC2 TaxID=2812648 RepID=UPI0019672697|nr:restriction endonuclease subunit S [Methylococcus sp. EFPC2]QSA98294.1 restriction endonuclease subunit S [Methylococcus sp. EFPC2]
METTTLGELISLQRGYDLTEMQRRPGNVPIVGSAGVHGYHDTARAKGPGVMLGRSGASFGKVTFIREDYWPHNTTIFVTDFKGNEPLFVRYLLESLDFSSLNSGSAQQSLNRNFVYPVKVPKVSLPEQRRIAGILSAYDDLIENCQRRIKILETMARALYREWFVHFRFPGHENVPRVASPLGEIPQGWEVQKLGEILELNYGKALKKEDRRDGACPVFGSSGVVGTHETALVQGPGIIVGRKGNVGSVFWCDDDFFVIDTAYFVTSKKLPLRYLFYVLPTLNFINSDAAVPGLSRNQAYALNVLVPPADILSSFCGLADAFERQGATLQRQIQNLRRARDLLLPRLLSGQIDVEAA